LESISSLGFWGEALPSIAAVTEVEVFSQTSADGVGSHVSLSKRKIVRHEGRARPEGTTITVSRLFRYSPAQLKSLKSVSAGNSHLAHLLSQYALAFPEVRRSLVLDGHISLRTTSKTSSNDTVASDCIPAICRGIDVECSCTGLHQVDLPQSYVGR
jgi:DNA mismatch repair protein MutL